MAMEVSGRIQKIDDTKEFGSNGFRKRELVIVTEEQYPQSLLFEFTQNNVTLLDQFQNGEQVSIHFNLRGREWTSPQGEVRYFVSLNGWRIERMAVGAPAGAPAAGPEFPSPAMSDAPAAGGAADSDDLPF